MLCCRYKFRYPGLLHLAFNHASVDGRGSYALAWLGDAALMMIVTEQMGVLYPGQERGDFSTLRSHAISRCAALQCTAYRLQLICLYASIGTLSHWPLRAKMPRCWGHADSLVHEKHHLVVPCTTALNANQHSS